MVDFDLPPIGALMKGCSGCDALESRTVPWMEKHTVEH